MLLISLTPGTTKWVVCEACIRDADVLKKRIVELGPGDGLVYCGDLAHAGISTATDEERVDNYCVLATLSIQGIERSALEISRGSRVQSSKMKLYPCPHPGCMLLGDSNQHLRTHKRHCAKNPERENIRKQQKTKDEESRTCTLRDQHFAKVSAYYHKSRHHPELVKKVITD